MTTRRDPSPSREEGETAALRSLKRVSLDSRLYAVLRHAHREEGSSVESNHPPELTVKGREDARSFGRELPRFRTLSLSSTPAPRARATASEIMRGFLEVAPRTNVVDEGADLKLALAWFYSRNDAMLRDLWERLGRRPLARAWLDGHVPQRVLPPVKEAVHDFVREALERLEGDTRSTLRIGISHDLYLAILREVVFGTRFEDAPPIGYLDGLVLEAIAPGSAVVHWGSEHRNLHVDRPSSAKRT